MDFDEIERARGTVAKVATHTPLFNSRVLSARLGSPVVLKAENLQRTGSFKLRGATAKLAALGAAGAGKGIVVASAGNHAQAVAFAASAAGVPCEVFMPQDASVSKAEAAANYGAVVHLGGEAIEDCLSAARAVSEKTGKALIHPFDDEAVIAGQGTLGVELAEDVPGLATAVVPLGGGGLAAGISLALSVLRPEVRVVAVQAASCAPWPASLAAGRRIPVHGAPTLADGIAIGNPGDLAFPIVAEYVDEVVTVSEDEIAEAMVLLMERAKLVVEGAGAVGVAAVLSGRVAPAGKGTGAGAAGLTAVVLSGGNVDTGLLWPAIRRHETNAGRRLALFARVSDRPGQLARLLSCLGGSGANLVAVDHLREGFDLHVRETGVQVVLETRNPEHAAAVVERARSEGFDVMLVGHAAGPPGSGSAGASEATAVPAPAHARAKTP